MRFPHKHYDAAAAAEVPVRRGAWPFFGTFGVTFALLLSLVAWWIYSPGQEHFASISLNGDHNYEIAFEIQGQEIFYHYIGRSSKTRGRQLSSSWAPAEFCLALMSGRLTRSARSTN